MTDSSLASLQDRRVLVAEDEYMIAEEIVEALVDAGAVVLGPVSTVGEALDLLVAENEIHGALLDVNLVGRTIWPVVDVLLARGVPMVLATGYEASAIPPVYIHLPRCEKPVGIRDLTRAIARQIAKLK
ncbi:response regulator [Muricoccus vinaceus]|uniref:Response regulator n=1 Tax=Muricoccus vinaceus TaxID=424704 RepID=A0ABV6ISS8_9PROT